MDYSLRPGKKINKPLYDGNDILISVITTAYASNYILETANCVLSQTFPYFEWIIINDGSKSKKTLEDLEVLKKLDKRIKVYDKENEGVSRARDFGTKKISSSSKYLVFLDDDDLIDNNYLEVLYYTLEINKDASWAYTDVVGFGNKEYLWKKPFDSKVMKKENLLVVTSMIRKEAFFDVNGFEIREKKVFEDWNLWLKLLAKGHFPVHVSTNSFWYRIKDDGELVKSKKNKKKANEIIKKTATSIKNYVKAIEYPREVYNWELIERNKVFVPKFKNNSKINILFIFPWMVMGGADKFNLDLITSLDKEKYSITIVTTQQTEYKWKQKFEQVADSIFELPSFLDRKDWPAFMEYLIESRNIGIVFNSNSTCGYMLLPYIKALFKDIVIIDYIHMEEWYNRNGGYSRDSQGVTSVIDKTYFCNKNSERILKEHFNVDSKKAETIYIGVDTDAFDPKKFNKEQLKEKYNIPKDKKIINFIARIDYQKRPYLFLEIVSKLVEKNKDVYFVVAGDGPLFSEIKKAAKKKKINKYIKFLGKSDSPSEVYMISDLNLNCSIKEGLALTSYESLSLGIPVVSCDVGGQKELITKDVGVIVPCLQKEEDVYEINYSEEEINNYVIAIEKVLNNLDKYKSNCRKHVIENFNVKDMCKKFDNIFKKYDKEKSNIKFDNLTLAKELIVQYFVGSKNVSKYYCELYNIAVYGNMNPSKVYKRKFLTKVENVFYKLHIHGIYDALKTFAKDFVVLLKSIYKCTIRFAANIIKAIFKRA